MTLTLILLVGITGGVGIWKSARIETTVTDLAKIHLPLTHLIEKLSNAAADQQLAAMLYVIHREERFIDEFRKLATVQDRNFQKIIKIINTDSELVSAGWPALINEADRLYEDFITAIRALVDAVRFKDQVRIDKSTDELESITNKFAVSLKKIIQANVDETRRVTKEAGHQSYVSRTLMEIVCITMLIMGLFISCFITRSIIKPENLIIGGLSKCAQDVRPVASQVSSSSQSLEKSSFKQTASIEETIASFEDMAAITKQNANHADKIAPFVHTADLLVTQANESMVEPYGSMSELTTANEETFRIIKAIDEIASQTNLLALNAAVEPVRIGKSGVDFAGDADEFRNLTMRAADTAKDTAGLIERTVARVRDGLGLVDRTRTIFS